MHKQRTQTECTDREHTQSVYKKKAYIENTDNELQTECTDREYQTRVLRLECTDRELRQSAQTRVHRATE